MKLAASLSLVAAALVPAFLAHGAATAALAALLLCALLAGVALTEWTAARRRGRPLRVRRPVKPRRPRAGHLRSIRHATVHD